MSRPLPTPAQATAMTGALMEHFGIESLQLILNEELSHAHKASLAQQPDLKNWIQEHPQEIFQAVSHSVQKTLSLPVPSSFKSERAFEDFFRKLPPPFQISYLGAYEKYAKARDIEGRLKVWRAEGFGPQSSVAKAWEGLMNILRPSQQPELEETRAVLAK